MIATLATRSAKEQGIDRDALLEQWQERAWGLGLDLVGIVRDARERSNAMVIADRKASQDRPSIAQRGKVMVLELAERLGIREGDPLVPARIHLRPAQEIAAAHAVASAVRHLSEREEAFKATDLAKAALDLGLPTTMPLIEKRIGQLADQGALSKGRGAMQGWLTTTDAVALESRMLAEIEKGKGGATPIIEMAEAGPQLQASASLNFGMRLNAGQEAAGRIILSSTNRIVAVQGVAGVGKSSLLRPTAQILAEHGKRVIGLGVQNTLVRMLERDTGIPSMTVHRFLGQHRTLLDGTPGKAGMAEARAAYRDAVLVLDEASMVSIRDQDRFARLANLLEVDRLVLMGDPTQLGAVEAGKPFALALAAGTETARMETNLRARSEMLKLAQAAAQQGRTGEVMEHLKGHIVEVGEDSAIVAAERWLTLPPAERERTGIYVSGRQLRDEVNAAVQTGLAANGEIGPDNMTLTVLSRVNATREELRHARTYAPGMVLEVATRQSRHNLAKGRYDVLKVDAAKVTVELRDNGGHLRTFLPSRMGAKGDNQALQLHERKVLTVYTRDTIRWTANDHQRGLINADRATITAIADNGLTVRTSTGMDQKLEAGDPMLARIDLDYALNAHMAQGLTSDKGIAVMDSRTRKLLSARNFLVTITRLRDELTLIVDNRDKVEMGIGRNPGDKTSALEVTERLGAAAAKGLTAGKPQEITRPQDVESKRELERTITKVVPFEMGI